MASFIWYKIVVLFIKRFYLNWKFLEKDYLINNIFYNLSYYYKSNINYFPVYSVLFLKIKFKEEKNLSNI